MPITYTINQAIIFESLAFISFCVSYQVSANRLPIANRENRGSRDEAGPTSFYTAVYLAIGVIGLWCSFGSVGNLITYYTDPSQHKLLIDKEMPATLAGAAGTFFKPFLGFAFVLMWCHWVDHRARSTPFGHCLRTTATMAVLVLFGYSTFNYNRGSFVAPLIAMAGVFLARIQRLPLALLLAIGSIMFSFVLLLGVYRSGRPTRRMGATSMPKNWTSTRRSKSTVPPPSFWASSSSRTMTGTCTGAGRCSRR